MSATTSSTYNFKVVLLGEGCVGKTSILLRYIEDKFNDKHLTTLQVCIGTKVQFERNNQLYQRTLQLYCREAERKDV